MNSYTRFNKKKKTKTNKQTRNYRHAGTSGISQRMISCRSSTMHYAPTSVILSAKFMSCFSTFGNTVETSTRAPPLDSAGDFRQVCPLNLCIMATPLTWCCCHFFKRKAELNVRNICVDDTLLRSDDTIATGSCQDVRRRVVSSVAGSGVGGYEGSGGVRTPGSPRPATPPYSRA